MSRVLDEVRGRSPELPEWAVGVAVRRVLDALRDELAAGGGGGGAAAPGLPELAGRAAALAQRLAQVRPCRVINATGVVLHTNLGRAPLARGAAEAALEAATAYSDLELDVPSGRRGNRLESVCEKLCALSGAEAALAVNNNAAAVVLALNTLARGREVVVSRGELVEIGGSFRIPDIMERAGARLVEVGTTNRTHAADYRRAAGPETALLLKVHRSNFEQRGFVAEVGLAELAEIGRELGLPVVEDLGSGTLVPLEHGGFPPEAYAPSRLARGADLVCFSGDKLLGGPQAGILLGSAEIVGACRRNPLARALRLDKLSLASLDWTLAALLDGRAERELPALRALLAPADALRKRAEALAERLESAAAGALDVGIEPDRSAVGGGSLPDLELPTHVVTLRGGDGPDALAERLRLGPVPVLVRVRDGAVVLDPRTLLEGDDVDVAAALADALARASR